MKTLDLQERAAPWLPKLVFVLCVLQPILDVLSYWLVALEQPNTLTTVLRFAMLAAILVLAFVLSPRKRYYLILGGVLLALTAGHIWACSLWGYEDPAADLANLLRIFQLPLLTLAFITFIRQNKRCIEAAMRGFFWCLLLCGAVEVLSQITGTNPFTYPNKEIGLLGWFYFPNSQSAVLSVLFPVALVYALQKWPGELLPFVMIAAAGTAMLYLFATRLAYLALIAVCLGLLICLLLFGRLHGLSLKRPAAVLLICAILAAAGYGISPMQKNNYLVAQNKIRKQQDILRLVEEDGARAQADGLEGEALETEQLRSAYEKYLTGPTGRFGLERTARWYGFSTDAGDIADVRREKLTYNRMLLEDCPTGSRLFGLEREDLTYGDESYDVENDFHGIYYLTGLTGLALLLLFLGAFCLRILLALIRRFRETFTPEAAACGLGLCCLLVHAYFTAGVLRRPNVNFYLAVLLAMAYGLTMARTGKEARDA